ncbi:hypothetical protein ACLGIH_32875 [Streptomyces sp. HMX87]|uniref:hypothetical protein n=1 Tax=Streptomyces sp. HMX87 TaxID=3390849 RepID=UPI003A8BB9FA
MDDRPTQQGGPTDGPRISNTTVPYVTELLERLLDEHGQDEHATEQAFHDAVQRAWVREEPWAVECVATSRTTLMSTVDGAPELAGTEGWDSAGTSTALPGAGPGTAKALLEVLEELTEAQQRADGEV